MHLNKTMGHKSRETRGAIAIPFLFYLVSEHFASEPPFLLLPQLDVIFFHDESLQLPEEDCFRLPPGFFLFVSNARGQKQNPSAPPDHSLILSEQRRFPSTPNCLIFLSLSLSSWKRLSF